MLHPELVKFSIKISVVSFYLFIYLFFLNFDYELSQLITSDGARKFSQGELSQIYYCILVVLTLYINTYNFIFGKELTLCLIVAMERE